VFLGVVGKTQCGSESSERRAFRGVGTQVAPEEGVLYGSISFFTQNRFKTVSEGLGKDRG